LRAGQKIGLAAFFSSGRDTSRSLICGLQRVHLHTVHGVRGSL
jgi:hypothetical protein